MNRRRDSTASSRAPSIATSTTPSTHTITRPTNLDNKELAKKNDELLRRNEELTTQSELNQDLFNQCSQELLTKETEISQHAAMIAGLKACIRQSDKEHAMRTTSLTQEIEGLTNQLAAQKHVAAQREGLLAQAKDQSQKLAEGYTNEQVEQKQHIDALNATHQCELDTLRTALTTLSAAHETKLAAVHAAHDAELDALHDHYMQKLEGKDKTIQFLHRRLLKAETRIGKLTDSLRAAEQVGVEWTSTIMFANKKAKARAKSQVKDQGSQTSCS